MKLKLGDNVMVTAKYIKKINHHDLDEVESFNNQGHKKQNLLELREFESPRNGVICGKRRLKLTRIVEHRDQYDEDGDPIYEYWGSRDWEGEFVNCYLVAFNMNGLHYIPFNHVELKNGGECA